MPVSIILEGLLHALRSAPEADFRHRRGSTWFNPFPTFSLRKGGYQQGTFQNFGLLFQCVFFIFCIGYVSFVELPSIQIAELVFILVDRQKPAPAGVAEILQPAIYLLQISGAGFRVSSEIYSTSRIISNQFIIS